MRGIASANYPWPNNNNEALPEVVKVAAELTNSVPVAA
jgi:hypothetical protein